MYKLTYISRGCPVKFDQVWLPWTQQCFPIPPSLGQQLGCQVSGALGCYSLMGVTVTLPSYYDGGPELGLFLVLYFQPICITSECDMYACHL